MAWRECGVAALLDSAAVERQLLLPSARRPGLRSTTAGLPPAPQERAKARVWASSASHRDARVDAVTPPLAGKNDSGSIRVRVELCVPALVCELIVSLSCCGVRGLSCGARTGRR